MGSGGMRPSGTVTFLFTDIEGSTRRWESAPDAMRAELAAHDEVLRVAIESQGGWLFKHTGDGVCAAFPSARAAVDAATDAQRALRLPVRMGIATGEAEQRGEDYFGPALNRAARVMAVGHGGQILVSATAAALVSGVDLQDLGEHQLRDLAGAEHLFQVRGDGLIAAFPRLRTANPVPGNLPMQATSFVGRDVEVEELVGVVRTHRLVTLTGVGGVGKTRLAVQVAAELVPDFGDGVWLAELAPVGDPAAVPDAVANSLGIIRQPGRTVTESVVESLAGRRLLVVVDNCEHVLDAAADLVEAILARASRVTVIATSREGLRVGAEHLWPVPSLDVRAGAASAAVELFVERARAAVPGFSLGDEADTHAVEEICRRLDGIALAIELGAARMVSMTPTEVLTRLNDRFRLLSGSRRGLERHQTLRQAVQWSYDLLTSEEQLVLGCCSVFANGFDLAAATTVVDGGLDDYEVLDLLDSLVRKSLVTATHVGGITRYGLLETIRQFAEDQLAAGGTIAEARDRHARWYASQAVAHTEIWLRTRADRRSGRAVAVAPDDEFHRDQDGGCEAEGCVSVVGAPVGAAAELTEVRQPRVGGLDDPSQPESHGHRPVGVAWLAAALDDEVVEARSVQLASDLGVVVAAVEVHRVNIVEQAVCRDCTECGLEELDVIAVRAIDRPTDRDTVQVDTDGPLPAEFGPIGWVAAGAFAAIGGFVQRPVDGDFGEVEADDLVERGEGFGVDLVEHASGDPLVTSSSQGGVGDLEVEDRFDVDP